MANYNNENLHASVKYKSDDTKDIQQTFDQFHTHLMTSV